MAETLIDTAVIVDALRRKPRAAIYLASKIRAGEAILHPLVAAEVIAGARNKLELSQFKNLLADFQKVSAESADWDDCLRIYSSLFLAVGLGWEDCLIAATALRLDMEVATLNEKHFKAIPKLKVFRPY